MVHFAASGWKGTPLWVTAREGFVLWSLLLSRVPILALVVQPDHVHVVVDSPRRVPLVREALRAYALWRNHHRGETGPVFDHRPEFVVVRGGRSHRLRTMRYVALNPCRAGLAADPLAWPFSTYRDMLGLALDPARPRVPDPASFHAFVSADPSVRATGTELPPPAAAVPVPACLDDVLRAVAGLFRVPRADLARCLRHRAVAVAAARHLSFASRNEIAETLGISTRTVSRLRSAAAPGELALVRRATGDRRIAPPPPGYLPAQPSWQRYLADAARRRRLPLAEIHRRLTTRWEPSRSGAGGEPGGASDPGREGPSPGERRGPRANPRGGESG